MLPVARLNPHQHSSVSLATFKSYQAKLTIIRSRDDLVKVVPGCSRPGEHQDSDDEKASHASSIASSSLNASDKVSGAIFAMAKMVANKGIKKPTIQQAKSLIQWRPGQESNL